jgi:hypothetical protein
VRAGAQDTPLPPLVAFSHSNSGWTANISFADPVMEIQWSLAQDGPYESTGFLHTYDSRTRRPLANPSIELDAAAAVIYVRYADLQRNWVGPFAVRFDPDVEIKRFYRSILEMTSRSWLAFWRDMPNLLYYTHVASYRCAIREFRLGINTPTPDRVINLPPCDLRNPIAIPSGADPYLRINPSVALASAQLVYQDGSVSRVRVFRR